MKRLFSSIIGLATILPMMAVTYNSRLTWDAEKFYAPTQEIVTVDETGKTYVINKEYNALLKERHTEKIMKRYNERGHKMNVRALSNFFGMIVK